MLATEFIFPSHSKILFLSSVASALDDLTQLYLAMSRSAFQLFPSRDQRVADISLFRDYRELLSAGDYNFDQSSSDKIERSIEITLGRCSAHLTSLKVEITLIHKVRLRPVPDLRRRADQLSLQSSLLDFNQPIRIYRRVIQSVQRLSDLLISIAVIREKIPREATVTRVLQQRKDLVSLWSRPFLSFFDLTRLLLLSRPQVSSILVHLFACSHAFRSRLPLPQFLPSPREAVRNWEAKALEGLLAPEDRQTTGDMGEVALLRSASRENPGPLHRDAAFLCE